VKKNLLKVLATELNTCFDTSLVCL